MNKKNQKMLKINFGIKEDISPFSLSDTSDSIAFRKAKRLFNAEEKFVEVAGENSTKFSEEEFNNIYQTLSEEEKKLYRIWSIDIEDNEDVDKLLQELRSHPDVEFADIDELNILYYLPNDPLYPQLWGLNKIDAECGWDRSQGENIVVAVLDTGVNYNHPDIKDNMWKDSNGNFGYDFSDNDNNPIDYHGHGSHVAGTIAATGNNNIGMIGVAPKAKIMAIKIFPNAYDSVIVKALKYAVDNGAKVLNNSWGPSNRRPSAPILEAAVNYVYSKGGICIFAAGNDNDDVQYYSPANMATTITVGASDSNDKRAPFSNFGTKVDVAAPGVSILSLRHNNSGYINKSGTSMASPHVAGAAALILSKETNLNFNDVREILKNTGDPINPDKYIGKARINVCSLLKNKNSSPVRGIYTIQQKSNNRFMDAHTSSGKDFSVVTRTAQNNNTQKWMLTPVGVICTIQQKSNNRFMDAHENSNKDFSVVTRTAQNNNTQKWALIHSSTTLNTYSIQQLSNGRFLDAWENAGNDFNVVTRTNQNNDTQKWILNSVGENIYRIQHKINGRFLDAHEYSNKDFSVVTRTVQNNDTQKWILNPLGKIYTVQQLSNGRFLDAHENSDKDFSVVTRTAQNNTTQYWAIMSEGYQTYTVQQLSNGQFLDAHEYSGKDFSVVTRTAQNNDTQRWFIKPV